MREAYNLIEFLENLDMELLMIVQKLNNLQTVNFRNFLNSYTNKPLNLYPNFAINKTKDCLMGDLFKINKTIKDSRLIEKIMSYKLFIAGAIEVVKSDIEDDMEKE